MVVRSAIIFACIITLTSGVRAADPQPPHPLPMPATALKSIESRQDFWSFKPIANVQPPQVDDSRWSGNPVDRFVFAAQRARGLEPAKEADRLTLIRRVTFDLIGLPPTPEEIRAFLNDKSPNAYEKLIDRLLASPHYGERWGRHWLDVARYVPGRISFTGSKDILGDSAYRDYVVRAFNDDKPFDQFLTEQIAGDLLPPSPDRQQYFDQIIAPAFLSLGPWFDMETDPNRLRMEMIDEMIGTTSQAFLGLSMQCARCHDHKFDPISTEDYYAMAGVFGSTRLLNELSEFWRDGRTRQLRPLATAEQVKANDAIRDRIKRIKDDRRQFLTERRESLLTEWRSQEPSYRAAAAKVERPWSLGFEAENFDGQDNLRITQLMRNGKAVEVIETQTPTAQWVMYRFEVPQTGRYRLRALYSADAPTPTTLLVNGESVNDAALNEPTGGWGLDCQKWGALGTFELRKGVNFIRITSKGGDFPRIDRFLLHRVPDGYDDHLAATAAAEGLASPLLANFILTPDAPWPNVADIESYLTGAEREKVAGMTAETDALAKTIAAYPQVVAVTDGATAADMPVHIKGGVYSVGDHPIRRGPPALFDGVVSRPEILAGHSGRLELARWMTDPRNPLPARVMVNRIWQGHFGLGIVATPSDFGLRGEPPTHPELLDWLAREFIQNGWSVKHLHKLILMSRTYRQCADATSEQWRQIDPDNKLLSHFTPRRLEVEAIYDAMRSTTNMIPRQPSGEPLNMDKSGQRMMYVLSNRRAPPNMSGEVRKMFTLFDFDLSGAPLPKRPTSTTPAQPLFFLNNPLPKYMADKFADRLLKMDKLDDLKRLETAYLLALGHPPTDAAAKQALAFVQQSQLEGLSKSEAWSRLCQALYATAEFRLLN